MEFGLEEVIELYEEGWRVKVWNNSKLPFKGICLPNVKGISIFKNNIEGDDDYNITLIHEMLHAYYQNLTEGMVETYGKVIYEHFPEVADYIKEYFNVKDYEV